jgi:hypothetical protein
MFAKNIIVDKFSNTKPEKEPESYLKNIKLIIIFNWITGFFPATFDKNLIKIKFSWISWTTVGSVLRIIILISSYLFSYKFFIKQNVTNTFTSIVHELMMTYEIYVASLSDLVVLAFFPKLAENLTKLVTVFQEMKVKGRNTKQRNISYCLYTITITFLYNYILGQAFLDSHGAGEVASNVCLFFIGSLR